MTSNEISLSATPHQNTTPRTAVVVLGTPRSGASAMAGMLARLGCDLPAIEMPATALESHGFYKANKVYALNHTIMTAANTDWQDWRPFYENWSRTPAEQDFTKQATDVFEQEFGTSSLFVLKDPHLCRLVPLWHKVLKQAGCTPAFVMFYRNPMEVAASLEERNKLPVSTGLMVWLRYVLDAEAAVRGLNRSFVNFANLLQDWKQEVDKIEKDLDLTFPARSQEGNADIDAFLTVDLKHYTHKMTDLVGETQILFWVRETFAILERWATHPETAQDHETLEHINREFSKSVDAYDVLDYQTDPLNTPQPTSSFTLVPEKDTPRPDQIQRDLNDSPTQHEGHINAQTGQSDDLRRQLGTLSGEHDALRADVENSKSRLKAGAEHIRALLQKLDTALADRKAVQQNLSSTQSALAKRQHDNDEAHKEIRALRQQIADLNAQAETNSGHPFVIASLEGAIKAQQNEIERYITEKSSLAGQLQDRFRELAMMAQLIKTLEDCNSVTQQTAQHATAAQKDMGNRLQKATEELQTSRKKMQESQAERERLQHAWKKMKASTSWRITAPLRRIVNTVRRKKKLRNSSA